MYAFDSAFLIEIPVVPAIASRKAYIFSARLVSTQIEHPTPTHVAHCVVIRTHNASIPTAISRIRVQFNSSILCVRASKTPFLPFPFSSCVRAAAVNLRLNALVCVFVCWSEMVADMYSPRTDRFTQFPTRERSPD